jgi:hypothetical protein
LFRLEEWQDFTGSPCGELLGSVLETLNMDVIFDCPYCEQELEVDATGAGSEIKCPSCDQTITIPKPGDAGARVSGGVELGGQPHDDSGQPINPIASSAAAKVEMHLKVPVRDQPTETLIEKPPAPLEVTAKESDKRIRIKTIRHTDCVEVGHDRFDEVVSQFLGKVGEKNIISINSFNYSNLDIGTQKMMSEYGVLIIYRG